MEDKYITISDASDILVKEKLLILEQNEVIKPLDLGIISYMGDLNIRPMSIILISYVPFTMRESLIIFIKDGVNYYLSWLDKNTKLKVISNEDYITHQLINES